MTLEIVPIELLDPLLVIGPDLESYGIQMLESYGNQMMMVF